MWVANKHISLETLGFHLREGGGWVTEPRKKCSRGLGSVTNTYSSIARFNAPSPDATKHKQNHQLPKLVWGERAFGWKSTEESWLQFLRVRTASPREKVCAKNPCPETEG